MIRSNYWIWLLYDLKNYAVLNMQQGEIDKYYQILSESDKYFECE